jgi:hypothetical protein
MALSAASTLRRACLFCGGLHGDRLYRRSDQLAADQQALCSADFNTCFIRNRGEPWHVADRCAAGQPLQPVSVGVLGVHRHSIEVLGFPAPLPLCSAACAQQISE